MNVNVNIKCQVFCAFFLLIAFIFIQCCSIYYGNNQQWVKFGMLLTCSIILMICFMGVIINTIIIIKFNHLEKLILENKETTK